MLLHIQSLLFLCTSIPISTTRYSGLHASGLLDDLILPELQAASLQLKGHKSKYNRAESAGYKAFYISKILGGRKRKGERECSGRSSYSRLQRKNQDAIARMQPASRR
jgi:hypothetical protein